jgi:hypothetical protein
MSGAEGTEGGQTTLYINKYYEKIGAEVTTYYYLGDRMVAMRRDTTLMKSSLCRS